MKAITVTQALKDLNIELFKNNAVGSIRKMNIPNSFFSLTHENGQRTDGYHTLDNSVHEADGFFDVVTPILDDAIEKLGAIFFDVDKFTYPIVAKTQDEQDSYIQAQEEADQYGTKTQTRRTDGDRMIERFFAYITRQNGEGSLSNQNAITSVTLIWDALLPLSYGQMEFTKILLNDIDQTGLNQPVKDIIDLGIQQVQDYLDNE